MSFTANILLRNCRLQDGAESPSHLKPPEKVELVNQAYP